MNPESLRNFLNEHEQSLILYARQWCNSPEDVVQEALMELVRKQLDPAKNIAWVYKVVRNKAISALRKDSKIKPLNETNREPWFVNNDAEKLDGITVTNALEKLEEHFREVIIARIWGKLTFEEIAQVVNISSSEAHRRYHEALESLRKHLRVL